jgi:hypothetical protein
MTVRHDGLVRDSSCKNQNEKAKKASSDRDAAELLVRFC